MGLFSNLLSQFQPKKQQQPVLQSVAPKQTAPKTQSTPQLFSSAANYSTPKYTAPVSTQQNFSVAPKPAPKSAPTPSWATNPISQFGQQAASGQGITAMQSMVRPTLPTKTQTGNKPTLWRDTPEGKAALARANASASARTTTPPPPTTTTPPPVTTPEKPTAQQNMLDWYKKSAGIQSGIAQNQITGATAATEQYIQMMRDSYGRQKQELIDQIPYLKNISEQTRAELLAAADDIRKSGALEKEQTIANYDEATLTSARGKRDTDAARQRMFAGLGTLDSTGSMGFTGQQINADEEFNRVQQNRETEKARALTAIDAKVATAERTAKNEIAKEAATFNETIRKIMSQANATDMDKEAQIRAAYLELKNTVQGINDTLAVTQQNGELEKLKYMAEQEKADQGANLSQEFIQTGIPKTAADFIYKTQNPGGFETKIGADAQGKTGGKVLQVVNNVLNGDIGAITGWLKTGWIPGSAGAQTKNDFENLKSMLSLEGRQQLKGSGAISDFEAGMLERAASLGLGTNLSEDQFRAKLNQFKQELEAGSQTQQGVTMNVRQKSSGMTGTIPVGEFDPNLYERI